MLLSAPLVPAGLMMPLQALAQGTPEATPGEEPLPPEVIFERLLATEITTPLFPSDTTNLRVVEWVDSSNTDLDGAIGGVLVQQGEGEDAPLIGVYIVFPTVDLARERIRPEGEGEDESPLSILGYEGMWVSDASTEREAPGDDAFSFSLLAVRSGTVIVSAIGERAGTPRNDLRALANLVGMLDHLNGVTTDQIERKPANSAIDAWHGVVGNISVGERDRADR